MIPTPAGIAYAIFKPLITGIIGKLVTLVLVVAFVGFGAWFLLDVNLLSIGLDIAATVVQSVLAAVADAVADQLSP